MIRLLITVSFCCLAVRAPAVHAQASPAADDLLIGTAALKAVVKELGRPTTVMAPTLGSTVRQLALSVGAKESSIEAGIRCATSVTGIHCQLAEKGMNVVLRTILVQADRPVAMFEINRQKGDEHMSTITRIVTLCRTGGRWEVVKIEAGPIA